ncbi:MAG: nucleotidyltransferase [Desulfuromonas sp.]|nr:MAG: nucleotidyltransferase [Desulfuromonas sp.]
MSDAGKREWRIYIDDMINFCGKVLTYTEGLDQDGFVGAELTYDATLRNLELIGEAATHIPGEIRDAHPEIPWRMIIATRNKLIHGYLGIDNDTLWSIIRDDVPELLPLLHLLKREVHP